MSAAGIHSGEGPRRKWHYMDRMEELEDIENQSQWCSEVNEYSFFWFWNIDWATLTINLKYLEGSEELLYPRKRKFQFMNLRVN